MGSRSYIRSARKTRRKRRFAAEILGIHLEGPFINPARRGVHPLDAIAPPSAELFEEFMQLPTASSAFSRSRPNFPARWN